MDAGAVLVAGGLNDVVEPGIAASTLAQSRTSASLILHGLFREPKRIG